MALIVSQFPPVEGYPSLDNPAVDAVFDDLRTATRAVRDIRQTQNVLQAVRTLHQSGNDFVAGLILFFSVTVPFLKALALVIILALRNPAARYRLYLFVRSFSKWAMADVFAVGVFIALLAAQATDNLEGIPGKGFYYFAAYCLVSNLAFQLLDVPKPASAQSL